MNAHIYEHQVNKLFSTPKRLVEAGSGTHPA